MAWSSARRSSWDLHYVPGATMIEKALAYREFSKSLRSGKLIRPAICDCCGQAHHRIHGHHSDYRQPLLIDWLCPFCHKQEHIRINAAIGWIKINSEETANV